MQINSSFWRCVAVAWLAFPIFSMASESHAADDDRTACSDAKEAPSVRVLACTKIIDAPKTSGQIRLIAYLNRATASYLTGKPDDAIRDYSEFISAQSTSALVFHERGLAYLRSLMFAEAIADFSEAIRLDSKYITAYSNRGIAYVKIKDYQKALADFNVILRLDPTNATALYNRSLILFDQTEYERAIVDLKKAVEIQPNNPDLYNQLAWTYLKMGSASKGLPYVNRSLELRPSANAYDTRGAIYEAVGSVTQAIDDYGHAISLDGSLSRSAKALRRLLAKREVSNDTAAESYFISELVHLVEKHGWRVDMGRMCSLMKLNSERDCKFKQISVSSDAPDSIGTNGFNVPEDSDQQYVVIYRVDPLVGKFFVVSLDGKLKSAFFRAKGIDYTEIPLADARQAFEASISFWKTSLEAIKGMIAAGDLRK